MTEGRPCVHATFQHCLRASRRVVAPLLAAGQSPQLLEGEEGEQEARGGGEGGGHQAGQRVGAGAGAEGAPAARPRRGGRRVRRGRGDQGPQRLGVQARLLGRS